MLPSMNLHKEPQQVIKFTEESEEVPTNEKSGLTLKKLKASLCKNEVNCSPFSHAAGHPR
jgi:hypothetical protein